MIIFRYFRFKNTRPKMLKGNYLMIIIGNNKNS